MGLLKEMALPIASSRVLVPGLLLAVAGGALSVSTNRLTVSAPLPVGLQPSSIVTGDFNGDGLIDIATGNAGNVSVLLGKGDGTFQAAKNVAALGNNAAMAGAAFRDGGVTDLIAVSNAASNANNAMLLLGDRDAGVVAQTPFSLPAGSASAVVTGDFNGDGKQDFAVAMFDGQLHAVAVFNGNGNGTFGKPTILPVLDPAPASLAAGSLRVAGRIDLAVTGGSQNSVTVFLNDGAGNFSLGAGAAVGQSPFGIAVADFNGDGKGDLAVANSGDGTVSVLLGNGTGAFTARSFAAGLDPTGVAVADFDGDGKMDIAVVNKGGNTVSVLLGNGDGTFAAPAMVTVGTAPAALAPGAFSGQSPAGLAVANSGANSVSVLIGQAVPATFTLAAPPGPQTVPAGQPATYAIATTAAGGASGTLSFSASGLPAGAAATFNPVSVAKGAGTTLTITTTPRATALRGPLERPGSGLPVSFAFVALLGFSRPRKKLWHAAVLGLLFLAAAGQSSCGGTSAASSTGTPAGSYDIAVTAISGAESHQLDVVLIVQ
jgi:hypothetical protein